MRVLQVGATFVGAQKLIEESIHRYLLSNGQESNILYAIGNSDDVGIVRYESRMACILRRVLRKGLGKSSVFATLSTKQLLKKIELYNPDVVHVHVIHHGYLNYEMLFAYLARKQLPVVFTLHDMWAFTGGCYYYSQINCEGYQSGCSCCSLADDKLDCARKSVDKNYEKKRALYEQLSNISFVAVSDWVRDEANKSMIRKYPIHTIWNAVPYSPEDYMQISEKDTRRFCIIGVAAAWGERKGINDFLQLAELLGDEYQIVLVGDASTEIKEKAPRNIRFVGRVTEKKELARLYASANLHVSMSKEETFGMTFVEAAYAGIRSIGFDNTAIPQVLQQVHGCVVKPSTVDAIVEQVQKLSHDRALCELTETERTSVINTFAEHNMAEAYLSIYNEMLGAAQNRRYG